MFLVSLHSYTLLELISVIFSVVDVVRTDSHLEFYEDARNLARMSDILAVYAWVDPATGYCQGAVPFLCTCECLSSVMPAFSMCCIHLA